MSSGGAEDDIPQGERKTVTDFCYLLDKSKLLLEFPEFGVNIKSSSEVGLPLLLSILRQISVKVKWAVALNFQK